VKKEKSPAVLIVMVILAVLVLSCVESTGSTYTSQTAGQPPAVTSTALRGTLEAARVDQYLQSAHAQSTIDAGNFLLTLTAIANQEAAATAAAQWTATAWALTVEADQAREAAAVEAERARTVMLEEAAHITATADAQRDAEATRVARMTETAEAIIFEQQLTVTAEAWSRQATAEAQEAEAIALIQAAEAEKAELEAQRARLTYPVRAYGPWVMLFAAVALLLWGGYRLIQAEVIRRRVIQRDARGDAPLVVVERPGGEIVVFDPDRGFWPVTVIDAQGQVTQPALTAPELQERVTAHDQAVDLATRGLPGKPVRRQSTAAAYKMAAPPLYRILKPGAPLPGNVIDVQALPALDQDWKERGSHDT